MNKLDVEFRTIKEMCDIFKVTPRTLRFYEFKELLFPMREGQRRLFTRRDQARLKLILQGKRFGFSLEEIRQLLNLYDLGDQQKTQLLKTYELANERLRVMISQKDELTLAIDDLKKMLSWGEEILVSRGIKSKKKFS
ncbi:MAG: MerR family DNA-binding transcriptional regulator [Paracoccaceae bacterium]|tara:strand:+ start:72 stop:485 length:414 start_codon:yes stop_codon:yes gene_type:complete